MIFTLLFLIFTLHGLSASSLGTVILSVIIPLVMVVVSLVVKKYMKEVRSTTFEEYLPINEEQEARESQPLLNWKHIGSNIQYNLTCNFTVLFQV